MDKETKRMVELCLAWCGPLFVLTYIIFFGILGHYIPPPNMMGMTPEQLIAEHYGKYQNEIIIGMIGAAVVGLLYLPWSLLLASMLRDENGSISVLGLMEAAGGTLTAWLLAFCPAMWAAVALFAHTVDPNTLKFIHVLTWFIFDCTYMITTVQLTGLGLYVVLNRKQTIFPAWTGWAAIATGIIFIPLSLIPFVTEGSFTVAGTWNFWIVFSAWLFVFFSPFSYFMLKECMRHGEKETVPVAA